MMYLIKRLSKNSLILTLLMILAGCSSMNSQFDCPMKPGVMCKRVDEVNTMVDRGQLGREASIKSSDVANVANPYPIAAVNPGDPLRYSETVMRVWIAPYEDKNGNYYQPSVMYTVVKPGSWLGQPVKAMINEDEE